MCSVERRRVSSYRLNAVIGMYLTQRHPEQEREGLSLDE